MEAISKTDIVVKKELIYPDDETSVQILDKGGRVCAILHHMIVTTYASGRNVVVKVFENGDYNKHDLVVSSSQGNQIKEANHENQIKTDIILEEGDYNFEVTDFERGFHAGSASIPPCNKVILTLRVKSSDAIAFIKAELMLYRAVEWRLSAFFRCISRRKHRERFLMDWNEVVGRYGRAHFKPRRYVDEYGNEQLVNEVVCFYDWDENYFPCKSEMSLVTDENR